jgi:outer membrane protein assembly factor BamB
MRRFLAKLKAACGIRLDEWRWFVRRLVVASAVIQFLLTVISAGDTAQLGLTSSRNNVASPDNVPVDWSEEKSVKWSSLLGTQTNGSPVVAGGRVFIGTNNGGGRQQRYPRDVDLGVLLCIDQDTGRLLWQYSCEKLPTGKRHDWPEIGICSAALVDADRLWLVSSRGEVVCLDVDGFMDEENDGPVTDEEFAGIGEADVIWRLDMMKDLGVQQHNMANCSVTLSGNVLLVCTSNGIDRSHEQVAASAAPSFLGLNKTTGCVIWSDNSPGGNILHGQWSSPAVGHMGGTIQAVFAGGDGWLYSFDPRGNGSGGARLLWKFDCNPKESRWGDRSSFDRNNVIAMPVIHEEYVYVATGQSPDRGAGPGRLWCIDAARNLDGADVSDELAIAADGQPLAHRRLQAVDRAKGETVRRNPESAAVWCYTGGDWNNDGKLSYHERMHRSISNVAVCDNLLIAVDASGIVHCMDAGSGASHWTHDTLSDVWASPLIVGNRVFVADADGTVSIFELAADPQYAMQLSDGRLAPRVRWDLGDVIHATPTASKGMLYVATQKTLYALKLSQMIYRLPEPIVAR